MSDTGNALINPSWSPDGNWIVYAQVPMTQPSDTTPESSSLWMTSTQGEGTVRLTTGHGVALSPVWSKSDHLFFVSNRDGVENVWSMRMQDAVRTASALVAPGTAAIATELRHESTEDAELETASETDRE